MLTEQEYVYKQGAVCPVCGSANLTVDNMDVDGAEGSQPVSCDDCGREWTDNYQLTGYCELTDGRSPAEHRGNERVASQ